MGTSIGVLPPRRILLQQGGNFYEAPHSDIGKRQRGGLEVIDYSVDRALVVVSRRSEWSMTTSEFFFKLQCVSVLFITVICVK